MCFQALINSSQTLVYPRVTWDICLSVGSHTATLRILILIPKAWGTDDPWIITGYIGICYIAFTVWDLHKEEQRYVYWTFVGAYHVPVLWPIKASEVDPYSQDSVCWWWWGKQTCNHRPSVNHGILESSCFGCRRSRGLKPKCATC